MCSKTTNGDWSHSRRGADLRSETPEADKDRLGELGEGGLIMASNTLTQGQRTSMKEKARLLLQRHGIQVATAVHSFQSLWWQTIDHGMGRTDEAIGARQTGSEVQLECPFGQKQRVSERT